MLIRQKAKPTSDRFFQYKNNTLPRNTNYHHHLVVACLLVIALFVIGCAAPVKEKLAVKTIYIKPVPDATNWVRGHFNLQGRVSLRNQHQRNSGNIRWQHTPIDDEISLFSPLGQTIAVINNNAQGAYLTTAEKKNYRATNVESLTAEVLGWRLPLSGLQYWILGKHAPATASAKDLDQNGQVVAIRQDGWRITYIDYFAMENSQVVRPRIVELNYRDLKIRLVVDNWKQGI